MMDSSEANTATTMAAIAIIKTVGIPDDSAITTSLKDKMQDENNSSSSSENSSLPSPSSLQQPMLDSIRIATSSTDSTATHPSHIPSLPTHPINGYIHHHHPSLIFHQQQQQQQQHYHMPYPMHGFYPPYPGQYMNYMAYIPPPYASFAKYSTTTSDPNTQLHPSMMHQNVMTNSTTNHHNHLQHHHHHQQQQQLAIEQESKSNSLVDLHGNMVLSSTDAKATVSRQGYGNRGAKKGKRKRVAVVSLGSKKPIMKQKYVTENGKNGIDLNNSEVNGTDNSKLSKLDLISRLIEDEVDGTQGKADNATTASSSNNTASIGENENGNLGDDVKTESMEPQPKKKLRRACDECTIKKIKCIVYEGSSACYHCAKRKRQCVFSQQRKRGPKQSSNIESFSGQISPSI